MFRFLRRDDAKDRPRYRTLADIGEGGDAVVRKSIDATLQRIVAVKSLKSARPEEAEALRVFMREGRLMAYLEHPGVVPLYDHFLESDGRPSHALKLVQGETLAARLGYRSGKAGRPLPVVEAVRVATHLAETLAYAHDRGVAHLDLKPENVMLGPYGEVLLLDWGNARLFDPNPYRAYLGAEAREEDVALLMEEPPDLLSGTPHFMAPEQTERPRSTLGQRADVFSLGTLLYLMLTGDVPFHGGDVRALLRAVREDPVPPPRTKNPEIPERLAAICTGMLAKREADRPADMHQVLAWLADYRDAGQAFPRLTLAAGDVLFHEGDEGDAAYVLLSGRVRISKASGAHEEVLADLGPGEIFGEIALLTGERRSATVRAIEASVVRVLGKVEVEAELGKIPPWVAAMVETLGRRFLSVNEELVRRRGGEP